ncbi:MAG TPA: hypothetical protein VKX28_29165 [Xanthobacteraceae bacterium]|nr:hypothetical protein [Xanthobacteraceae bacterium]
MLRLVQEQGCRMERVAAEPHHEAGRVLGLREAVDREPIAAIGE